MKKIKMNDKGFIDPFPTIIICLFLLIAISVVTYLFMIDPWMVSNEVKEKIRIDYPYDDYKSIFCVHDSHNWWTVLVTVFDIQSGNSSYCSLRYNRDTGELKGNFDGVSLRNPEGVV